MAAQNKKLGKSVTTKKKLGGPTKYKPEYVQAMIDHFSIPAGTWKKTRKKIDGVTSTIDVYVPNELPLLQTFARKIGVAATTLYAWLTAEDAEGHLVYPEFAQAYAEAKKHQERILIHNGLNDSYKTSFAIFTMKNICGWRDAMSHELTGKDGGPIRATTITDGMSVQQAADAYADTLKESA